MGKQNFKELLDKYHKGNCNEEEKALVESWYLEWETEKPAISHEELYTELNLIKQKLPKNNRSNSFYYQLAAAVLIFISVGSSIYFFNHRTQKLATTSTLHKITPGRNQAVLTLADGSTITLDTGNKTGVIPQNGVNITKLADGKLVYTSVATGEIISGTNTIETPRGGKYELTLTDGTRVILNAASKLTFPVAFGDDDRTVELSGEAYFEVAKSAGKFFQVRSGNQTVQVLGTHFNVHSYADEPIIKTTLLEGSVMVKGPSEVMLKPGEQSQNIQTARAIKVIPVDVKGVIAWKDNLFYFENEPIEKIMLEISRWYDVEIVYQDNMSDKKVWGSITRFSEISKVLEVLALTSNIHFKVQGRRIVVMK